jgi:hypothetical protein
MSVSSKKVIDWRKRTKEQLVNAMGGCCVICGYNKCNAVLAFHHLDPSKKDFSFGGVRANPQSIDKIIIEVKKCIMVCHNCHTEIHAGITSVPENVKSFDEEIYKTEVLKFKPTKELKYCFSCNKEIPLKQKACSTICANKNRSKIDWSKIDLENELKTKYISQLAKELGCSDNAINKRLKKMGIDKSSIKRFSYSK